MTSSLHFSVPHVGVICGDMFPTVTCLVPIGVWTMIYTVMHSAEHVHVADGPTCMVQGLLMVWWKPAGRAECAVGPPMRSCAPFSGY